MLKIIKHIFCIFLLDFLLSGIANGSDENYCTDQKSWEEWDNLVEKYPDDEDIQIHHALRLCLCFKVERGDITVEQATNIFENARNIIIKKKESEKDIGGI